MPPVQPGNGNKVLYAILTVAFLLLVALGTTVIENAKANAVDNVRLDRLEQSFEAIDAKLDKILGMRQ